MMPPTRYAYSYLGRLGTVSLFIATLNLAVFADLMFNRAEILDIEAASEVYEGRATYTYGSAIREFAALTGTIIGVHDPRPDARQSRAGRETTVR